VSSVIDNFSEAGCPCYIYGPPGSGKSYLASTIYGRKGTLYSYDCAPVSEEIVEKELLEDGSMISPFSGIYAVIIKHIDRLSPRLQRAVLEKCRKAGIVPVGLSEHSIEELKEADRLTEEFISAFAPYQVQVYSLGERAEDLKHFIDYYLGLANEKYARSIELTPRAMGCLLSHDWKENIDEVHRTMERIVLTSEKKRVDVFDLPDRITGGSSEVFAQKASLKDMLEFYESGLILQAYEKYKTSVAVAQKIGISQATAIRKIHKYAGRDVE
jgi:DNA-binding NtrC family response regulator